MHGNISTKLARQAKRLVELPSMFDAALSYAARGWQVFLADSNGLKKSHKSAEFSNGQPWGATSSPAQIRRDFKKWPRANIGITLH